MTCSCPTWEKIDARRGELDDALRDHLAACDVCAAELEAVERLARLARELPHDRPDADRVEQVRTVLLGAVARRTNTTVESRGSTRGSSSAAITHENPARPVD